MKFLQIEYYPNFEYEWKIIKIERVLNGQFQLSFWICSLLSLKHLAIHKCLTYITGYDINCQWRFELGSSESTALPTVPQQLLSLIQPIKWQE